MRAFLGAKLEAGFSLFARHARLAERMEKVDLVITGEGAIDEQTLMGKGVGELAGVCRERKVPCVALAGVVRDPAQAQKLFVATHALTPEFASREQAMTETAIWLERLAERAAQNWRP